MERDRHELARVYQVHGSLVFRRSRRLLGSDQAAKDACQEVFLRLWHTPAPTDDSELAAWLYRVTTNHCLNFLRDEKRRAELVSRTVATPEMPGAPLALLLRGIPEHLHEAAIYYFVDGMSQAEIAEVTGLSQRTVSNRITEFRSVARVTWGELPQEAP